MLGRALFTAVWLATSTPSPSSPLPGIDSYETQVEHDIDRILHDHSRGYLIARAQLVAHPEIAVKRLQERLAHPGLDAASRKRIVDVLAQLGDALDPVWLGNELRTAVQATDRAPMQDLAASMWLAQLTQQGPAAVPVLLQLAVDASLSTSVRRLVTHELATIAATDIASLLPLLVHNDSTIRRAVRTALVSTLERSPHKPAVMTVLDQHIRAGDESQLEQTAVLLHLRARLDPKDRDFSHMLFDFARDAHHPFELRIGAVRALAVMTQPDQPTMMAALADAWLREPHRDQATTLLGWQAARSLSDDIGRGLAVDHNLIDDPDPRLADLGYRWAPLDPHHAWLETALQNPWPSIIVTALQRVAGDCDRPTTQRLFATADPELDAQHDDVVSRAAVQALGRCSSRDAQKALSALVRTHETPVAVRTEAARQLVRHHGHVGADIVARVLNRRHLDRKLAHALASTLRFAPEPTQRVIKALCRRRDEHNEVSATATRSLWELHQDPDDVCANRP